jgi:flagellar protein FlbD
LISNDSPPVFKRLDVIKLTKINGTECFLNHALIETIEEAPDTCITMSNGNRYLVKESGDEIQEKIISFNVEVLHRAGKTQSINVTGNM